MKIELTWTKETKNTHVYANEDEAAIIPTLYIRKIAFKGEAPNVIRVTVEEIE